MAKITKTGEGTAPLGGLTEDQLKTIGRIAVAHSFLEFAALLLLGKLLHHEPARAVAIVGGDPLPTQLSRIRRLLSLPDDDLPRPTRAAMVTWVDHVEKLKDERNRVLHSTWVAGVNKNPSIQVSFRKGRASMREVSADDLSAIAESLELLAGAGFNFLTEVDTGQVDTDDVFGMD